MDENYGLTHDGGLEQLDGATEAIKNEGIRVRGFYRVNIEEDGKIVGDSGWKENQVTNLGFNYYLCQLLGAMATSRFVGYMGLGTGGAPGAADTSLAGEVEERTAVTAATSSTSKTVRFTATFSSAGNFVTTTMALSNVGLFHSSSGGTLFAGNTYNSSNCATNQNVNLWRHLLVTVRSKLRKFGGHLLETIPSQAPTLVLGKV